MTTNASFQDDASNVVDAAGDSKYCPEDIKIIPRTRPRENPTAIKHRSAPPIPSSSPTEIIKNETQQNHALPTRTKQRLIKVDYSLLQDDDFYCDIPGSNRLNQSSNSLIQMPLYPTISYNNENNPNNINTTLKRTTYDLATQYESRRAPMRRHTIVGCQSNETQLAPTSKSESTQSDINSSSMSTTSQKIQGDHQDQVIELNSMNTGNDKASSTNCNLSSTLTKNSLNENQWTDKISDRLSLTLEEIVHIRSVMTKAELEGLPVGIKVKEDVERRKVCFLCLRTRFSIFGPWGIQCKLCQRTVCSKCYTKMTIPTEHLRNVPVVLLSPSLMNTPISSNASSPSHHSYVAGLNSNYAQSSVVDESLPKSLFEKFLRPESNGKIRNSVGSAPSSPKHQRSTLSTSGSPNDVKNQTMIKSDTSGISDEILDNYKRVKNISNDSIHAPINRNDSVMSKSMEGPKSLPVQSPARPHSNSSTLDRKNRFSRAFTLSSSGHLSDHKENSLRGELMAVCNDCKSLVLEIIRSSRQTRSPARNRALKNLTLDLSPVYKTC